MQFGALVNSKEPAGSLVQPRKLQVCYIWAIPIGVWQKLMHALHGNGSIDMAGLQSMLQTQMQR